MKPITIFFLCVFTLVITSLGSFFAGVYVAEDANLKRRTDLESLLAQNDAITYTRIFEDYREDPEDAELFLKFTIASVYKSERIVDFLGVDHGPNEWVVLNNETIDEFFKKYPVAACETIGMPDYADCIADFVYERNRERREALNTDQQVPLAE